ncbi:MAG: DUF1800 domain-containing protein, partial [Myxococcales bacterium]|nr:DUF1800 domain-containing protein [Myxococcales bacterium]
VLDNDQFFELNHRMYRSMLEGERPLADRMALFWHGFFPVSREVVRRKYELINQFQFFQENALGNFETLLRGVAHDPAMLWFLDNDANIKGHPNENYARELMELHTLGVDGPWTETDVREVARALTGWSTDWDASVSETGFLYRDDWHDPDGKLVLGTVIPAGGGEQDGVAVLQLLANHPATAAYVSRKLAERFIGEDPQEALVQHLARTWRSTGGDLRAVMRALLLSPQFRLAADDGEPRVKRPLVLMASLARALEASGPELASRIVEDLDLLGEPLYLARPPTGFPDTSSHWSGNGALLHRFNIFYATARGWHGIDFEPVTADDPGSLVDAWLGRLFVREVPAATRNAAVDHLNGLPGYVQDDPQRASREVLAVLLASPEFLSH